MSRSYALPLLFAVACGDGPAAQQVERSRSAVINGITDPGHWYVGMTGNSGGGDCTGTLISPRTVITAGHCWGQGQDAITRVFFDWGSPQRRTSVQVANSVRHPGYDDFSLTNDLALVQLASDAPVQPVPLLRETLGAAHIGPSFAWVGYGDTDVFGNGFGTRRVVTFPIQLVGPVANIFVPASAPGGASDAIDATQFYFQVLNKNTCTGDSGGPAFVVRNGVERHAGVTSYGDDQCAYDGVAARTDAARMTWIQATIDAFEPNGPCRSDGVCGAGCTSTAPAPLGTLQDPDCADQHCGADGICVLSCSPVDPDCASLAIDNCRSDGVCKGGCQPPDVDCVGGTAGGSGTGGGSAGGGAAGGSAGSGPAGGAGGGGETIVEPPVCGCSSAASAWPLLFAFVLRRRRS